jgi:hypothetical protein
MAYQDMVGLQAKPANQPMHRQGTRLQQVMSESGHKQPSSFWRYDAERLLWSNIGRHLAVKKTSIHWHSLTGLRRGAL